MSAQDIYNKGERKNTRSVHLLNLELSVFNFSQLGTGYLSGLSVLLFLFGIATVFDSLKTSEHSTNYGSLLTSIGILNLLALVTQSRDLVGLCIFSFCLSAFEERGSKVEWKPILLSVLIVGLYGTGLVYFIPYSSIFFTIYQSLGILFFILSIYELARFTSNKIEF